MLDKARASRDARHLPPNCGLSEQRGTRTHLCASPVEQATDRGKDDTDDEEKRQHGLGGQDGPVAEVNEGSCCLSGVLCRGWF